MPSKYSEPTIEELVRAFHDGVRSRSDKYADSVEGSVYDHFAGVAAVLWSRQARRDTDLFRSVYFASSEGDKLTALLSDRYDFDRVLDANGTGLALLRRPSATSGAGTIWAGTRIAVTGPLVEPRYYVVTSDHVVGASSLYEQVAIYADLPGKGTAIGIDSTSSLRARVDDPLWDTTWFVDSVYCDDGTEFESASAARARFREERQTSRAGFVDAIIATCKTVGAANVVAFPSDYAGDAEDYGLNMVYVGDEGFNGSNELVATCRYAVESARVLGDNIQVRPMARSQLSIKGDAFLWDSPARVNQDAVTQLLIGATKAYFEGSSSGYSYSRDAMVGWLIKASSAVQYVEFESPESDAGVVSLVSGRLVFPATLNRYFVEANDISFTLRPPL